MGINNFRGTSMASSRLELDGIWKLKCVPAVKDAMKPEFKGSIEALVPGDVHLDLKKAGIIPDPMVGDNVKLCSWIGEQEWIYERDFEWNGSRGGRVELVCEGLCLMAEVRINGRLAGTHKNMHRPFVAEVSGFLKGKNRIVIKLNPFDPASLSVPDIDWGDRFNVSIPSLYCRKRGAMRKAAYTFGWDWTQALPVCGIWQSVRLESVPEIKLRDFQVIARASGEMELGLTCERSQMDKTVCGEFEFEVFEAGSGRMVAGKSFKDMLGPGLCEHRFKMNLETPKLWWPAGYGEQPLYRIEVSVRHKGLDSVIDKTGSVFGFRDVRIVEENIAPGRDSFTFEINGRKVFASGADWVPPSLIPGETKDADFEHLIVFAKKAGMNYLRLWGGGVYPPKIFYDLCDRLGIMIWNDFMFGNYETPDFDPSFIAEVEAEVTWAAKALRNHPSIVIWCGSNETDAVCGNSASRRAGGRYYGYKTLHEVIPAIVSRLDTSREYRPSSPCPGRHSPPDEPLMKPKKRGVDHGIIANPFSDDAKVAAELPAFLNEWYSGSPTEPESLDRYLDPAGRNWSDEVFSLHNFLPVSLPRPNGAMLIEGQLTISELNYLDKMPFTEACRLFSAFDVEYVRASIEQYRRNMWACSGHAYWMINSAYPAFDWSLIDYYGLPKAAWYSFKRASARVLPCAGFNKGVAEAWIVNCSDKHLAGELSLSLQAFDGKLIYTECRTVNSPPDSSVKFFEIKLDRPGWNPQEAFARIEFAPAECGQKFLNHRVLAPEKELKRPAAHVSLESVPGEPGAFRLKTDNFASRVSLRPIAKENIPDDNCFDMLPGEEKIVRFPSGCPAGALSASWENAPDRPLRLYSILPEELELSPGAPPSSISVALFNSGDKAEKATVNLSLPDGVESRGSVEVEVPPRSVSEVKFKLDLNPCLVTPGKRMFKVEAAGCSVFRTLKIGAPFEIDAGRRLISLRNDSSKLLEAGEFSFEWSSLPGVKGKAAISVPPLSPGDAISLAIPSPAAGTTPYSGALFTGASRPAPVWIVPDDADAWWKSLPKREFDSARLCAGKYPAEAWPSLPESWWRLHSASKDKNLTLAGDLGKTEVLFALRHDRKNLYLDFLMKGMNFCQTKSGTGEVWLGTCVELAMSTTPVKRLFEGSLALTPDGHEFFLRVSKGRETMALEAGDSLRMMLSPDRSLLAGSAVIDMEKAIGTIPEDKILISMIFRTEPGKMFEVFSGISMGKKPEMYGKLKML